jgi:hypothetical protein
MVVVNSFRLHVLFQENIEYNTKAIKETIMDKLDENIIYIYMKLWWSTLLSFKGEGINVGVGSLWPREEGTVVLAWESHRSYLF